MAAAAMRNTAVPGNSPEPPKTRSSKRTRRSLKKFKASLTLAALALAFVSVLGWMSVYARLSVNDFSTSKLKDVCRYERMKNQRLKLQLDSLSSPHNVVAAAEKSGMVYATRYDYINKTQAVASVGEGVGE